MLIIQTGKVKKEYHGDRKLSHVKTDMSQSLCLLFRVKLEHFRLHGADKCCDVDVVSTVQEVRSQFPF